jgi:hypothetical protein
MILFEWKYEESDLSLKFKKYGKIFDSTKLMQTLMHT